MASLNPNELDGFRRLEPGRNLQGKVGSGELDYYRRLEPAHGLVIITAGGVLRRIIVSREAQRRASSW